MNRYLQLAAGAVLVIFTSCSREPAGGGVNRPPVAGGLDGALAPEGVPPPGAGNVPPAAAVPPVRPVDPYTLKYNPDTVMTLRGPALGFRRIALSDERTGLFVRVQSGGALPWVYLGPESWLHDQGVSVVMPQTVSVTGSMIDEEGQPLLIAREIETADRRVQLRDRFGTPQWDLPAEAAVATESRDQEIRQRREDYLKRVLAYHEREAAAIRESLRLERAK